jgi:hypothetical protein
LGNTSNRAPLRVGSGRQQFFLPIEDLVPGTVSGQAPRLQNPKHLEVKGISHMPEYAAHLCPDGTIQTIICRTPRPGWHPII